MDRGFVAVRCLAISFVLFQTSALKFNLPDSTSPGEVLDIQWTMDSDDPPTINLGWICQDTILSQFGKIQADISTEEMSFQYEVPSPFKTSQGSHSCTIGASVHDNPFDFVGTGSISLVIPSDTDSPNPPAPQTAAPAPAPAVTSSPAPTTPEAPPSTPSAPASHDSATTLSSSRAPTASTSHSSQSTQLPAGIPSPSPSPSPSGSPEIISFQSFSAQSSSTVSMAGVVNPSSTSEALGSNKLSAGVIVAAILGGILGALLLIALVFFCRRFRRRRSIPQAINFMHPTPSIFRSPEKHDWHGGAIFSTARQPEQVMSHSNVNLIKDRASSDFGHYSAEGYPSPITLESHQNHPPYTGGLLLSSNTPIPEERWENYDHLYISQDDATSKASSWGPMETSREGYPRSTYTSEQSPAARVSSMGSEDLERRKEELYDKMRRVLDSGQQTSLSPQRYGT